MRDSETVQGKTVRQARFNPSLDSVACTIVTIERHSSGRLSADPLYMRIYARSTRTGLALLGSPCCTESIIVFTPAPPEPPRFGSRLKFWRTGSKDQANTKKKDLLLNRIVFLLNPFSILPAFYSHRLGSTPTVPETIGSLHAIPSNRKFR
jgi:hypothetical protein